MTDATTTISILSIIALAYVAIMSLYAILTARKSIYTGSGDPVSMAQNLWKMVSSQTQIVFGVFGLTTLVVLVIETEVSSDVIFPLIGTLIGYVMGREYKESQIIYKPNDVEARERKSTSTSTSSSTSTSTTPPPNIKSSKQNE